MSSRRPGLERGSLTQHRPHYVDPATRQRDEGLSVPLTLRPLALLERPGLWRSTEAGEGRLVEYALEDLVPSSHPSVVTDPLTGVISGGHQPSVGSESVSTLEGRKVSYSDQKLRSKKRSHTRQTSEDWCLRAGEKTLPELLVDALDAVFEGENLSGKLCNDARSEVLCGKSNALRSGCSKCLVRYATLNPLTRRFLR
jgi:hypothetical protein